MLKFYIKYCITRICSLVGRGKVFDSKKHQPTAVIFSCPDHGNLGDVAIEYAEESMLSKKYQRVAKIYVNDAWKYIRNVRKYVSEKDVVCIQGGGSFGGLYPQADLERLLIINNIKARIISFPQSITYEKDNYRKLYCRTLRKKRKIYLYFRDKKSYDLAISDFSFMKRRIHCVPDIVFSLKEEKNTRITRNGAIMSFRSDKEKSMSDNQKKEIEDKLIEKFKNVKKIDTIINLKRIDDQYPELEALLDKYRHSELVITDRLHGMILAFITNTPCIAFSNNNGKIRNAYETWLSESKNIEYFDKYDVDNFRKAIKTIGRTEISDERNLAAKYEKIMREL